MKLASQSAIGCFARRIGYDEGMEKYLKWLSILSWVIIGVALFCVSKDGYRVARATPLMIVGWPTLGAGLGFFAIPRSPIAGAFFGFTLHLLLLYLAIASHTLY
ncbi:MAG TPA: hypothetical protein VMJ32_01675 [Pirellulales bacterium]|nr:hypothetical protein [Pirellulales bacterium]